jgi:5-hydroxyisourate hydrolase-like protein (transthyretin family)
VRESVASERQHQGEWARAEAHVDQMAIPASCGSRCERGVSIHRAQTHRRTSMTWPRIAPCLRRSRTLPALIVALLLSAATIPAQAPEPLVLHILAADTGQPLQGVVVSIEPRVILAARGVPPANGTRSTGLPSISGPSAPAGAVGSRVSPPLPPPVPSLSASSGYWARTDAEGLAEIPGAEVSGPVSVRKPGYVAQTVRQDARRVQELRLVRGAALTVLVVDMSGSTVPEARVSVRCSSGGGVTSQADDRGQLRISGLPPGRCDVRTSPPVPPMRVESLTDPALAQRLVAITSGPVVATTQLHAGDDVTVSAPLSPVVATAPSPAAAPPAVMQGTASLAGTVIGPDRRPAVGVRIWLRLQGEPGPPLEAIANAQGRYAFPSLPPGRYGISPVCPCRGDTLDVAAEPALTLIADTHATRNFVLQKGAVLRGRVLDEFGEPEEGVTIQVYRDDLAALPLPIASTRTDDRGDYRVAALLSGAYRVAAVIRREKRREEMMFTGSQPAIDRGVITLAAGAEISGIEFNVRLPRRPAPR